MDSPSSEKLLQERHDQISKNLGVLFDVEVQDEEVVRFPFQDLVRKIQNGTSGFRAHC